MGVWPVGAMNLANRPGFVAVGLTGVRDASAEARVPPLAVGLTGDIMSPDAIPLPPAPATSPAEADSVSATGSHLEPPVLATPHPHFAWTGTDTLTSTRDHFSILDTHVRCGGASHFWSRLLASLLCFGACDTACSWFWGQRGLALPASCLLDRPFCRCKNGPNTNAPSE